MIQFNTVFRGAEPEYLNACVGNNGNPSYNEYYDGYSQAAIILIDTAIKTKELDTLIYPICFNMRHAIELRLKQVVLAFNSIKEKISFNGFSDTSTHDIIKIWEELKHRASMVDERTLDFLYELDPIIEAFAEIDPTGQTFRYPFSNGNEKHLTKVSIINIWHLKGVFEKTKKQLNELFYFINYLRDEYATGTYTKKCSRETIKRIAKELPLHTDWYENYDKCLDIKSVICEKYSISGNEFGRVKDIIHSHYEFSAYVGLEVPLKSSIADDWVSLFEEVFPSELERRSQGSIKVVSSSELFEEIVNDTGVSSKSIYSLASKISPDAMIDIASVFYLGRQYMFSEDYFLNYYDEIKLENEYVSNKKSYLQFVRYLATKTNLIGCCFSGLRILNQKSILAELKARGFQESFHEIKGKQK